MGPRRESVDTQRFEDRTGQEYREAAVGHWSQAPCGANYAETRAEDLRHFEEVERHRYASHPWLHGEIASFDLAGKTVLEVGVGMGTDHLALARLGARAFGLDLTPRSLALTRRRLELHGVPARLARGDAERLPFEDESFDFVYSFGVLHHAPDTARAVAEVRRVLRPGGSCWIAVYHRNSLFFWWTVFGVNYLLRRGFTKRTLKEQLSLIEYPNTDQNLVVRLFRRAEFLSLFSGFRSARAKVRHLLAADLPGLDALVPDPARPRRFLDWVGRRLGWYVIVEAAKG